jgi:catechol 2,3-dioxygenase-like lactoylglutathione lyase family enzyme
MVPGPLSRRDAVKVDRLDHLVLTVASIDATVGFYTQVLGMQAVTFGAGRTALRFGTSKINLHEAGHEFEPKALRPTPASADICLVVEDDIATVIAELAGAGVTVEQGIAGEGLCLWEELPVAAGRRA